MTSRFIFFLVFIVSGELMSQVPCNAGLDTFIRRVQCIESEKIDLFLYLREADSSGVFYWNNKAISRLFPYLEHDLHPLVPVLYIVQNETCRDTSLIRFSGVYKFPNKPLLHYLPRGGDATLYYSEEEVVRGDTFFIGCEGHMNSYFYPNIIVFPNYLVEENDHPDPITYSYYDHTGNELNQLDYFVHYPIIHTPGIYKITAQSRGCVSDTAVFYVLPPPIPKEIIERYVILCGDSVNTYFDNEELSFYSSGLFYIDTIMSQHWCDSIYRYIEVIDASEELEIRPQSAFCHNDSVFVGVPGSLKEEYEITELNDAMYVHHDTNGHFKFALKDGCLDSFYFDIQFVDEPLIDDIPDTILIEQGTTSALDYTAFQDYEISIMPEVGLSCFDCHSPTILEQHASSYTIVFTDEYGCQYEKIININTYRPDIYVPNAINIRSPLEENTVLRAYSHGTLSYSMSIYNRWGDLVYQEKNLSFNNPENAWRPHPHHQNQVFLYKVEYQDQIIYGTVTVL